MHFHKEWQIKYTILLRSSLHYLFVWKNEFPPMITPQVLNETETFHYCRDIFAKNIGIYLQVFKITSLIILLISDILNITQ